MAIKNDDLFIKTRVRRRGATAFNLSLRFVGLRRSLIGQVHLVPDLLSGALSATALGIAKGSDFTHDAIANGFQSFAVAFTGVLFFKE